MFTILSKAFLTATRTAEGKPALSSPGAPWRQKLPRLIAFPDA